MFRRILHAARQVLPPDHYIGLAFVTWLAFEGTRWLVPWWYGFDIPEADAVFRKMRDIVVISFAGGYGLTRATARHPYYRAEYRRWLELTPWTADRELPIGPIQLVWQDAVVLALLAAGMYQTHLSPWIVLSAFTLTYAIPIANSLFSVGLWRHAYGIWFLLGLGCLVHPWLVARLIVIATAFVVARIGTRDLLLAFPWNLEAGMPGLSAQLNLTLKGQGVSAAHGWPHGVLAPPVLRCLSVNYRDGLLGSILAGWLLFVIPYHIPQDEPQQLAILELSSLSLLALARLVRYVQNHGPPQSRLGMVWRLRPIAPRYDYVFLAPVLVILAPLLVFAVLTILKCPTSAVGPICVTTGMLIAFNFPPTYANWALTGDHHTRLGARNKQQLKEI